MTQILLDGLMSPEYLHLPRMRLIDIRDTIDKDNDYIPLDLDAMRRAFKAENSKFLKAIKAKSRQLSNSHPDVKTNIPNKKENNTTSPIKTTYLSLFKSLFEDRELSFRDVSMHTSHN